ncbi:polyhydroxyalkanoic acid system family protein, partial [Acidovorax sp.]|uniref:polyhydroxyalkanoic acid system family protein n=1 Tax=Acidovorax sp. TaxID=1872122 RepID=UPI00391FA90B
MPTRAVIGSGFMMRCDSWHASPSPRATQRCARCCLASTTHAPRRHPVPDIHIHREHHLGFKEARKVAFAWAEQAEAKFDM